MIEYLWDLWSQMMGYLSTNFDPWRDTIDLLLVSLAVYWLLLLIRGTRAVQILMGLLVLYVLSMASEIFHLVTLQLILAQFTGGAVIIIVFVLFQHEIRRALAQVGRGFFRSVSDQQESQMLEEVVRASQILAQKRVGALIVLERETGLDDQIESGTDLDSVVSKELLISIFLPYSPLHDGAVVIQHGRLAHAGCILPLTLRVNLPEGVGTRHRAAVGITEETDAVVIVVSEETASISVAMGGEILSDLDAPRLRAVLRDALSDKKELQGGEEADAEPDAQSEAGQVALEQPTETVAATSPEPRVQSAG